MKIKDILTEAYEIEFVCVNPNFCDATDQKDQDALFNALKSVPGIIVYRQDFDVHNSMAAIIQDESNTDIPEKIQQLAKQHGVGIDLENDVSQSMIDDIVTGRLEGLIDYYDTTVNEDNNDEIILEDSQDFHKEFGYLAYSIDENDLFEAEYQGKKVTLNKPIRTGKDEPKKFKVYVKDGDKVKMVRFGHQGKGNEKTMKIKKSDPSRRKSFRARHNCDNPGPKTKARYWSCRAW